MQDRPTARELLTDIADLLENDVVPMLQGPLQHQVRVAGNLCRILERELGLGPAIEARETELLSGLLGTGPKPVLALNEETVARLRADGDEQFERAAWAVLTELARAKVAVAKPGHDSYDFSAETASSVETETTAEAGR